MEKTIRLHCLLNSWEITLWKCDMPEDMFSFIFTEVYLPLYAKRYARHAKCLLRQKQGFKSYSYYSPEFWVERSRKELDNIETEIKNLWNNRKYKIVFRPIELDGEDSRGTTPQNVLRELIIKAIAEYCRMRDCEYTISIKTEATEHRTHTIETQQVC